MKIRFTDRIENNYNVEQCDPRNLLILLWKNAYNRSVKHNLIWMLLKVTFISYISHCVGQNKYNSGVLVNNTREEFVFSPVTRRFHVHPGYSANIWRKLQEGGCNRRHSQILLVKTKSKFTRLVDIIFLIWIKTIVTLKTFLIFSWIERLDSPSLIQRLCFAL